MRPKEIIDALLDAGWEHHKRSGNNHIMMRWPATGECVSISTAKDSYNSGTRLANLQADVSRIERGERAHNVPGQPHTESSVTLSQNMSAPKPNTHDIPDDVQAFARNPEGWSPWASIPQLERGIPWAQNVRAPRKRDSFISEARAATPHDLTELGLDGRTKRLWRVRLKADLHTNANDAAIREIESPRQRDDLVGLIEIETSPSPPPPTLEDLEAANELIAELEENLEKTQNALARAVRELERAVKEREAAPKGTASGDHILATIGSIAPGRVTLGYDGEEHVVPYDADVAYDLAAAMFRGGKHKLKVATSIRITGISS
jgi:hypothetical protein